MLKYYKGRPFGKKTKGSMTMDTVINLNNISGQSLDEALVAAYIVASAEGKTKALHLAETLTGEQESCVLPHLIAWQ